MSKIDFKKDIYRLLGTLTDEGETLPFPEWDLLKELDRREKRKGKDHGKKVRKWMREHPEKVERIKENSGYFRNLSGIGASRSSLGASRSTL